MAPKSGLRMSKCHSLPFTLEILTDEKATAHLDPTFQEGSEKVEFNVEQKKELRHFSRIIWWASIPHKRWAKPLVKASNKWGQAHSPSCINTSHAPISRAPQTKPILWEEKIGRTSYQCKGRLEAATYLLRNNWWISGFTTHRRSHDSCGKNYSQCGKLSNRWNKHFATIFCAPHTPCAQFVLTILGHLAIVHFAYIADGAGQIPCAPRI